MKEHLGGVQEVLERRKLESLQELERKAVPVPVAEAPAPAGKSAGKAGFEAAKAQARQSRKQ